jgi:hypothetical protein
MHPCATIELSQVGVSAGVEELAYPLPVALIYITGKFAMLAASSDPSVLRLRHCGRTPPSLQSDAIDDCFPSVN